MIPKKNVLECSKIQNVVLNFVKIRKIPIQNSKQFANPKDMEVKPMNTAALYQPGTVGVISKINVLESLRIQNVKMSIVKIIKIKKIKLGNLFVMRRKDI